MNRIKIICMLVAAVLTAGIVSGCHVEPAEPGDNTAAPDVTAEPTLAPTEVPWQVDDQGRRLAGTDSGIVRDDTPKKYFTICFDDGITQDKRIIEIYKKYNFTKGTFYLNSGLFGVSWDWVGQAVGVPTLQHLRWTEAELRTGIYDGYDVEVHTVGHKSLKALSKAEIINEVQLDADKLYDITGIYPVGMAWPGGDPDYTKETMQIVSENTTIKFARGTTSTGNYKLPKCWLKWQPTCSITDSMLLRRAEKFIEKEADSDMLFYVWGHGYELDANNIWDTLDELIRMMTEAEDVVLVTNSEFYWLFKDEIPALN